MSWAPGRADVEQLLTGHELEAVEPDGRVADRLLADARRHVASAGAALQLDDLAGAYQLAYDALRKSAAALLAVQGLRATSRGGHVAVQDAVRAQFGGTGSPFRSFSRIRRLRTATEYPDTDGSGPDRADVEDALTVADEAIRVATALIASGRLDPWR